MAQSDKERHLELSGTIKGVHARLRQNFKESGNYEEVWRMHREDTLTLTEYATAMKTLATDHWTKNNGSNTRIHWSKDLCLDYFYKGGLDRVLEKDKRRDKFDQSKVLDVMQCSSSIEENSTSSKYEDHQDDYLMSSQESGVLSTEDFHSDDKLANQAIGNIDSTNQIPVLGDLMNPDTGQAEQPIMVDNPRMPMPMGNFITTADMLRAKDHHLLHAESTNKLCNSNICNTSSNESSDGFKSDCDEFSSSLAADNEDDFVSEFDEAEESLDERRKTLHAQYQMPAYDVIAPPFSGKIRLLDVGSCYNPFREFEDFVAIGIDIMPAVETVYKCDFLAVNLVEPLELANDTLASYLNNLQNPVLSLPRSLCHVVVFSFLLEYFPSCYQRWLCCQKAHELLALNGLLLIITPDSKAVNKNAPMMKSWKAAIEHMGFKRYKYEKYEHMHCMAFRKTQMELTTNHIMSSVSPEMLYIPQDFNNSINDPNLSGGENRSEVEDDEMRDYFEELPGFL